MKREEARRLLRDSADSLQPQHQGQAMRLRHLQELFESDDQYFPPNVQGWAWQALEHATSDEPVIIYWRGLGEHQLSTTHAREVRGHDRLMLARQMLQELMDYHQLDGGLTVDELLDEDAVANGERSPPITGLEEWGDDDRRIRPNCGAEGRFLMIDSGELSNPTDRQELLEQAGRLMDKACSWDILGDVLFVEDGEWYVASVETVIGRANPTWLKDRLRSLSDEMGSDQPEYQAIMKKLEELGDT